MIEEEKEILQKTAYQSRLYNNVIYVLMDQVISSSAGQKEENEIYHDTLLSIRNNPGQINEISDWVSRHEIKLPRKMEDGMSDELYDMIVDGIILIYSAYYSEEPIDIDTMINNYERVYDEYERYKNGNR